MNPYRTEQREVALKNGNWWDARKDDAHTLMFQKCQTVESRQAEYYDRLLKLAMLYDPFETLGHDDQSIENAPGRHADVSENVAAENVDTVTAIIAKWAGRAVFMTDDGDWSTQRQAVQLERYSEGLVKRAKVHEIGPRCFKDAAVLGMSYAKVYTCEDDIKVQRVIADEIVVDEQACRTSPAREMFHRARVDADVLISEYPDAEQEILAARGGGSGFARWAGYLTIGQNEVLLLEGWRLPIGKRGTRGYIPGRHVLAVSNKSLVDEDFHRKAFPFAVLRWGDRITGHHGLGLVEGLAGHQREINTLNLQEGAILDTHALPTTMVHISELDTIKRMAETEVGRFVPWKTREPKVVTPQGLTNQLAVRREQLKASAFERSGVSRLSAHGQKPAGLDSGAAQREYQDITTQRFAIQEKAYERFFLDIVEQMLMCASEMAEEGDAPVISYRASYLTRQIKWADVDMRDVEVQIQAANTLSKTLAGRSQTIIEWAQSGVITPDQARALMEHPDLEGTLSMYTAAQEDLERCIEAILDGEDLVPDPYQNLKMGIWLFQMSMLKARGNGAPEEILEALRTWITQAADLMKLSQAGTAGPMPMGAGAADAMPQAPMDPMAAPGMAPMPMGPAPQAAFAPQAMQVLPQ